MTKRTTEDDEMKISGPDHTNWRIRDLDRTLRFYRDVLGFEAFGLEAFERGESPLVSVRVTDDFILHFIPDPDFTPVADPGYDHLAFTVEGESLDSLVSYFEEHGVPVEKRFESIKGARGDGPGIYVRDPDGYRIELKLYPVSLP